jgi:hypothetical protein
MLQTLANLTAMTHSSNYEEAHVIGKFACSQMASVRLILR